MKNSNNRKIRLGLFVLIGTLIFIIAVYLIGQKQDMFKSTYTIGSYFQNINGLKKGNNVRYAGIDVGVVKGITMINDSVIKIEMTIDQDISRHVSGQPAMRLFPWKPEVHPLPSYALKGSLRGPCFQVWA